MTMDEISRALRQAHADQQRRRQLLAQREALAREYADRQARVQACKEVLAREDLDVERLERGGATRLLYQLLGKLEDKTEQERREAAAARLAYEASLRQLEEIAYEQTQLEEALQALADADARYAQYYALRRERLMQEQPALAEKIVQLTQVQQEADAQLREIAEAIEAGHLAREQLDRLEEALQKAGNWGVYDIIGGGMIADVIKHSHLDEAEQAGMALETALRRFRTELCDVKLSAQFEMRITGVDRGMDLWLDNIFTDWNMQARIRESQDSASAVREQLSQALERLYALEQTCKQARNQAAATLDQIIT